MIKTNWKELVGKRCLVTDHPLLFDPNIYEIKVLEVSPAGRVKVLYGGGSKGWVTPEEEGELTLVEVLE